MEPQRRKIRARERFGGRILLFPPSSRQVLEKSDVWEILDATEEGEVEEDNQQEHQGTEEIRKVASAISSNRLEYSQPKEEKEG